MLPGPVAISNWHFHSRNDFLITGRPCAMEHPQSSHGTLALNQDQAGNTHKQHSAQPLGSTAHDFIEHTAHHHTQSHQGEGRQCDGQGQRSHVDFEQCVVVKSFWTPR